MDPRNKKWLLLALFLVVSGLFGLALYWLFFRQAPVTPIGSNPSPVLNGGLPNANNGRPQTGATTTQPGVLPNSPSRPTTQPTPAARAPEPIRTTTVSDRPTSYLSVSPTGDGFRSYNAADGKFYRLGTDGSVLALSDQAFPEVKAVSWGKKSDQAILEFPDGSNILYDFRSQRQATLPKHWEDFAFSPSDEQIIAKSLGNNETNRFLVVANPDGSNPRAIQELGNNANKVDVSWSPNNQVVAFAHTGDELGFDRESVLLIGQNHENFKALVTEGRGLIPLWSPSGNTLLYSVYSANNGYLPQLWVSGASGNTVNNNRRNLQLNTWADKCTWASEDRLYCAVPSGLGAGAGLQRDAAAAGPDSIVRIDLTTGVKTVLGQPDGSHQIGQLTISGDQRTAFFTDRVSGQFFRYTLNP